MYSPKPKIGQVREVRRDIGVEIPTFINEGDIVGNWLFYLGRGDMLYDFSNSNHGRNYGVEWREDRKWNGYFDNDDSYWAMPGSSGLLGNVFTVLAWVKIEPDDVRDLVFSTYYGIATTLEGAYFRVDSDGALSSDAGDGSSSFGYTSTSATIDDGEFHQIGAFFDSNNGVMKHFLDGSRIGNYTGLSTFNIDHGNVWIGQAEHYHNQGNNTYAVYGLVSMLQLYDVELVESDVSDYFERTRDAFDV